MRLPSKDVPENQAPLAPLNPQVLTVNVNKIKLGQLPLVCVLLERPDDLHDGGGLAGAGDAADVHAAARTLAQLGLGEAQHLGELILAARQRVGHRADVQTGLEVKE